MYHQVRVTEVDAEGLRFLWQNDASGTNPNFYQMKVQILDVNDSPCCANYALKKTGRDHRECLGVILYDFLKLVPLGEQVKALCQEMI